VPLIHLPLHGIDQDLQPSEFRLAGDLLLGGEAFAQWHGDELAYVAFRYVEAVQPGLAGDHRVVLRTL
jgi:hypothetical protein